MARAHASTGVPPGRCAAAALGAAASPASLAAALLGGVIAACWAAVPRLWGAALLLATLVALGAAVRRRSVAGPASVGLAALLGAWVGATTLAERLEARLGDADAGVRLLVAARVVSLPEQAGGEWRADADVTVQRPNAATPRRLRLRLAGPLGVDAPHAGESWQFVVEVAPARARLNPGGFDMERQWLLERVDGFGRVVESPLNRRLAGPAGGLLGLRAALRAALAARCVERELCALVTALAIGDTAALTREQWRVFAATGTTHLVAISGLHVTLFAWLVGAIARPVWRALMPVQRLPCEAFALPAGVLAAFAYSLLAGFAIPTQRTVLMLTVVAAARLSGRVLRSRDVLGLACIGVLLFDPLAPLDAGFWLSFAAIWALMLHDSGLPARSAATIQRLPARLGAALRAQLWIGAALAPLTLLLFGAVSVAGWLANPLAIPVFSFVLVPLSLLAAAAAACAGTGAAADALLAVAAMVHEGVWQALRAVARQPWAFWSVELPPVWFVLAPLALAITWLPLPAPLRASATLCALPAVLGAGAGPPVGAARLTILDVGEGGAVIVQTRHHALLYGTGSAWGAAGKTVEQHVLPALRAARIARLDLLVLPQASAAEVAGSAHLLQVVPVGTVFAGAHGSDPPHGVGLCPPRRSWRYDGVLFELIGTRLTGATGAPRPGSCALRVSTAGGSVLLVGAASRADLTALLDAQRAGSASLRANVLIGALRAPHSLVQRDFTRAVAPDWWVATRRLHSHAMLEMAARSQSLAPQRMLAPSRHGALELRLTRSPPPRWSRAVEGQASPAWRQPRTALPKLCCPRPSGMIPR